MELIDEIRILAKSNFVYKSLNDLHILQTCIPECDDGGVAGSASGGAAVEFIEDGNETILKYAATNKVKGKIAQLANRLVLSAAKKLSRTFFENFRNYLSEEQKN